MPGDEAEAHPLGNVTVNHYDGLRLQPDRVELLAVVDHAEIPSLQLRPVLDGDADGQISPAEAERAAAAECAAVAAATAVTVDGIPLSWTTSHATLTTPPGEAGLPTTRVECALSAPAELGNAATLAFEDGYLADRTGWREITAAGEGVRLVDSVVPSQSASDELRAYPVDLLADPLDVRWVTLQVEPGSGGGGALPESGPFSVVDRVLGEANRWFTSLVGQAGLTGGVGVLAVVLALVLGASHALLPGHGKTVMAAYLAGKRGTKQDALLVGATVTATHTVGVLVIGLACTVSATFAPDGVLQGLGVLSGLLVAGVGVGLLRGAVRSRRAAAPSSEQVRVLAGVGTGSAGGGAVVADPDVHDRPTDGERHTHGHGHTHGYAYDCGHGHGEGRGHGHGVLPALGHGHGHGHGLWGHGHGHGHGSERGREGYRGPGVGPWSAWGSRVGWCRARPRCSSCSARSGSAAPGSGSRSCSATASGWRRP